MGSWDQIDDAARLARIRLEEDERGRLGEQLERIVGFVRKLDELDLDDVEPTRHLLDRTDVDRSDSPRPSLDRERVLSQAPESREGQFVVPAVLPDEMPDEAE